MMDPEADDFIGCILSIKTRPSPLDGLSSAIIGTVRAIDTKKSALTLDDVMINGTDVEDGYVLESAIIEDLSVCGKKENIYGGGAVGGVKPEPAFASTPKKPLQAANLSYTEQTPPRLSEETRKEFHEAFGVSLGIQKVKPVQQQQTASPANTMVKQNYRQPSQPSSAFVKTEKGKGDANSNPFYALNPDCGGPMGKGPLPTKPTSTEISKMQNPPKPANGRIVYTASELEQKYFNEESKPSSVNTNVMDTLIAQFSLSMKGNFPSLQETKGQETLPKGKVPVCQDQNQDPSKMAGKTFDNTSDTDNPLYKLFASQLSQSQSGPAQSVKKLEDFRSPGRSAGHASQTSGRPQKRLHSGPGHAHHQHQNQSTGRQNPKTLVPSSAFEMTNDEIKGQEFDFEENLAMFEKLPSTKAAKPAVNKTQAPQFGKSDTTFKAERSISSIKLMNEAPEKVFLTDTGVVVPAVSVNTRSKILNLAHNCGLTHGRMVEIMGRAVAQTAIPLLGDSYRLSPERADDRPSVVVFAGPHWNGAVGVCAARILATQGIRTHIFIWNYELPLLTKELRLYRMTRQLVSVDLNELKGQNFDLVIGAANDHRDTVLNVKPFLRWMRGKPIILVDPPLLESYRKAFEIPSQQQNGSSSISRLSIVIPSLPLAYPADPSVKLHLVNLGIPQEIFESNDVKYVSPFGDKLIQQLFATKQDISSASS